jgi:hypothetical protein
VPEIPYGPKYVQVAAIEVTSRADGDFRCILSVTREVSLYNFGPRVSHAYYY